MWWQRARQRRGGGVRGGCLCFFTFLLLFVVRGLTAMFVFFVERQRTANNSVTPSAPSISPSVCIAFFTVRHKKTHGTQNCRASREMVHYKGLFAEQSTAEQPLPQAREKKITEKPLSCVFFFMMRRSAKSASSSSDASLISFSHRSTGGSSCLGFVDTRTAVVACHRGVRSGSKRRTQTPHGDDHRGTPAGSRSISIYVTTSHNQPRHREGRHNLPHMQGQRLVEYLSQSSHRFLYNI
jgi:hypothetical protein